MTLGSRKIENCSGHRESPRQLSTEERNLVILNDKEQQGLGHSVEQDRITFNRASLLVLHKGIGRIDRDEEEFDDFFHPERSQELGKSSICAHLEELETEENFKDIDRNALAAAPKRESSVWGRLGRSLKNLGKMALTAGPKLVDAFLPNSLQTTPKLEAIERLQSYQRDKLLKAERDCESDLRVIERGYEAIRAYVDNFYGDLIVPFNHAEGPVLQSFIEECLHDQGSVHYKNVHRIIELRRQARLDRFTEERDAILADHSDQEMIEQIRESPWLLRAIDGQRAKASAGKESKKPNTARQAEPHRANQPDPPSNAGGAGGGGGGRKKSSNWLRGLATAAAVAIGSLVVGGGRDCGSQAPENTGTAASASSTEKPGQKTIDQSAVTPLPKAQTEASKPVASRMEEQKPAKVASSPAKVERSTPSLPRIHRPQATAAKTLPPQKDPTEISPRVSVAEPKVALTTDNAQEQPDLLSEEQKLAQLRLLGGKIQAYQKRVENIRRDSHSYPGNTETGRAINRDLDGINNALDVIMTEMKRLSRTEQIALIDTKLSGIDSLLARLDRRVVAINVAYASISAKHSQNLFQETQQLAARLGAAFSIEHKDPKTNAITTYNVNLERINKRLQEIHSQSLNGQHLSTQQARMLQKDAHYWVGYLKFVNWHLQYNSAQIQKKA